MNVIHKNTFNWVRLKKMNVERLVVALATS